MPLSVIFSTGVNKTVLVINTSNELPSSLQIIPVAPLVVPVNVAPIVKSVVFEL